LKVFSLFVDNLLNYGAAGLVAMRRWSSFGDLKCLAFWRLTDLIASNHGPEGV
jgi:hypothetical protein